MMRVAVAVVGKIASRQPRTSSSATLRAAPVPRHVKASGPDIAPCGSGFGLIADVSAISHGPPFTHKPSVQIGTVLMTDRNEAAIAVGIANGATDLPAADPVGERQRRSLPASPALTLGCGTKLPTFGCVNPMQSDALPTDFQSIAINDTGNAGQPIGMCLWDGSKPEQKEAE